MTSSNTITLFCLVLGEEDAFSVQISKGGTIEELKQAILVKNPNSFQGLDAYKLRLWKKVGPLKDIKKIKLSDLPDDNVLEAVCKIVDYFEEDPPARSIHIVIASSKWGISFTSTHIC